MSRYSRLLWVIALAWAAGCTDKENPAAKPESPVAMAPAVAPPEAAPEQESTVCRAFRRDLVQVRERLDRAPTDADLVAGVQALDAIIADTCN